MIIYLIIMRKLYLVYRQYTSVCDKNLITDSEYKIGKYFYVLLFLIIGSIGMVNIFTRSRFLFAYFLSVIFALKNKYLGLNHQIEHILLFFTIIVNSYYIYYILCNGVFL